MALLSYTVNEPLNTNANLTMVLALVGGIVVIAVVAVGAMLFMKSRNPLFPPPPPP